MTNAFYTNCLSLGNNILYRGYDSENKRVQERIKYSPSLFLKTKTESKYKTLDGKNVDKMTFSDINEARAFVKKYEGLDNFEIFGNTSWQYCYLSDRFKNDIEFDTNTIRILYFDIETYSPNGFPNPETASDEICAITLKLNQYYFVYGTKDFEPPNKNVYYFKCENEKDLLKKFIVQWNQLDPDIISGWNIEQFDIPYLINRITRVLSDSEAKKLSPWKVFREKKLVLMNREYNNYELCGLITLDYLQMYQKFVGTAENYKLMTIGEKELGEGKLNYEGSLTDLYANDFQKFLEYNIKDVELVSRIEDKKKLIDMIIIIAYHAKVNYSDVFKQVCLWDTIIFNDFRKKNLVLPPKTYHDKQEKYAGAYVKEPQIGLHDWVVSFDLDSLYPHLIAQFNISPETLVPDKHTSVSVDGLLGMQYDLTDLKNNDITLAANGHCFNTTKQGFLPEILMTMYADRQKYKNLMLEAQSELERIEAELKRRTL